MPCDLQPTGKGRRLRCTRCGRTFLPRVGCPLPIVLVCAADEPAALNVQSAPVKPARLTARLLAEIDAAIEAGQMAPWSQFDRDRADGGPNPGHALPALPRAFPRRLRARPMAVQTLVDLAADGACGVV